MRNVIVPETAHMRARRILFGESMVPVKLALAIYAFFVLAGLLQTHGLCDLQVCLDVPVYKAWPAWAVAWALYGCLKFWRVWDVQKQPRPLIAWAINFYGLVLVGLWSGLMMYARYPNWYAAAGDLTAGIMALWVFVRTARPPGARWSDGE